MEKHDYEAEMMADIREWLKENGITTQAELESYGGRDAVHDALWACDQVTGNGSASYTFSTWRAEENLCHNWELLDEALSEFGCEDENIVENGAEWCDVTIRCYLLGRVIDSVVDDLPEGETEDEEA